MKEKRDANYYPILINLQNFPCLVVGGGEVAGRKVTSLLEFHASVTVISPRVNQQIEEFYKKGKIEIIKRKYSKEFINNFKFVFCATDNTLINKQVHDDCVKAGVLINVADVPQLCDFILPANIKRGDLTISISSQGKAPFYVKALKKKLNDVIPPVYSKIIKLAGEYRKQVLRSNGKISNSEKAKLFRRFTRIDWEKKFDNNSNSRKEPDIKDIIEVL